MLRYLLRSFNIYNPVSRRSHQQWDLQVVLLSFTRPPYVPLEAASFRDLTKKTLFLLSLATVRRVGELQAVSRHVAWRGNDVSLSYLPSFVAKTESPSNPLPRHFLVRSLVDFVGPDALEILLCPVRALRM